MRLKEIKTTTIKVKGFTNGGMYVNCGKIFCGYLQTVRDKENFYNFISNCEIIQSKKGYLADIILHVECSLKEFVKKISYAETKANNK